MKRKPTVFKSQVTADDGEYSVKIEITFDPGKNLLQPDESVSAMRDLTRECADSIRKMRYTDFGPENTKVVGQF